MARTAHTSFAKQLADVAARDRLAAQLHLRVSDDLETHLLTILREHLHRSRGLVTEMEVESFVHFSSLQFLFHDLFRKFPWSLLWVRNRAECHRVCGRFAFKSVYRKVREGAPRTQRTSLRASGNSLRSLRSKSFFRGQASTFWEPLNLNFKLQLHPVIRQSHVGRQRCVRLLVRQIVTDMSEESALRPQSLDDLQ